MSLQDAIQRGLERNYDIRIERRNVDESINNNNWGEAGRYPSLDLNVNQNNNITDNVKVAFPTSTRGEIVTNSVNPTVTLNWNIFDGFRANISKHRLENLQNESEGNAEIVIANTVQSIILGYYLAVLEKERLNEFEKQLGLSRDKYDYLKVKADLGGAVTSDLLLEEGNYLTDSTNLINQQLSYRNALRNLNVLLADNPGVEYDLTDPLETEIDDFDFEELYAKLESGNLDLKKQYLTQAVLTHDVGLRKADRYPTLGLNASFNDNRQRLDLSGATFFTGDGFASGPNESFSSTTRTYAVGFTLSFNLFNGGKINRAIQNAVIREDVGNIRIEKMKNSLHKDLVDAYDQFTIRRQILGINSRKSESASQNLDISEDKFRNGTINSFDYRTVQNNQLVAAIQKLQSTYDLIDSKVELMRLTGGLLETYR